MMHRRLFLAALGLAPVAAIVPVAARPAFASGGIAPLEPMVMGESAAEAVIPPLRSAIPAGQRVSVLKGDPGERLYAMACGDGKKVKVYLDGVEQELAETADEAEGFVDRSVETPDGNIAINCSTGEILKERVYGDVRIVIEGEGASSRVRSAPNGRRVTPFPA